MKKDDPQYGRKAPEASAVPAVPCNRCSGTGLVCDHKPEIGGNNCCVDYANAICPACKGTGRQTG